MSDLGTAEILQRLETLVRQNFRDRLLGAGTALLVLAVFLIGQSKPNVASVLEAQTFALRDKTGNLRSRIGFDPNELPAIVMYDDKRNIVWRATRRQP